MNKFSVNQVWVTDWQEFPLILLVDDNEGNMNSMQDYLSQKGYRLLLADNGN